VLLVSHDRALLDAVAERTLAIEDGALSAYDGGWADYQRRREPPPPEPKPEKPVKAEKPRPPRRPGPTQLERVEQQVAAAEARVAELEGRLADDWGDVDLLAEHRRARDELQSLLERWETLFEA
jgi:hypothetical protein